MENNYKEKNNILLELQQTLKIDYLPRKIEMYDISNISGQFIVAAMCVAKDGIINKSLSRKFKIKSVLTQNDAKCMEEVLTRRIKHSLDTINDSFGNLPNVIFADGGIIQINAIKNILNLFNLNIDVFGIVKDNNHRTKALINDKKEELIISENIKNFITNFQDEVHNTAINYHKKLRDKATTKSELDDISGIGPNKKIALLQKFKTIENIKNATLEELTQINGININLAQKIKDFL